MSGIAQLQARQLARKGRYGDDSILHVSKAEIAGLDALARQIYGHDLSRNPETGQKEAFLFLPMLAPLLASSGVLGAGMMGLGALGTGALAAGAGTLEATARGMDNPLEQGLMSGITAGGMSALGSGIMGAGAPDTTSVAGAMGGGQQTADMLTQNIGTGATLGEAGASLSSAADPALLNSQQAMFDPEMFQMTPQDTAPYVSNASPHTVQAYARQMGAADPFTTASPGAAPITALQPNVAPSTGLTAPSPLDVTQANTAQFGRGLKSLATDDTVLKNYLGRPETLGGATAVGMGISGQSMLDSEEAAGRAAEEDEAKRHAQYMRGVDLIKKNYATTGVTPWWENPGRLTDFGNFADGGEVSDVADLLRRLKLRGSVSSFGNGPVSGVGGGGNISYDVLPSLTLGADVSGYNTDTPVGNFSNTSLDMLRGEYRAGPHTMRARKGVGDNKKAWGVEYQYDFANGGSVFPMQSGGFVVPKYAVDAAGAGSNERGLAALSRKVGAKPIRGKGTGTSDSIKATIDGSQPARVSNGEAYVPPKKVKKAGGAARFYRMLDAVQNMQG